jgi:hypothetical protein
MEADWKAAALFYWMATAVITSGAGVLWGTGGGLLALGLCMIVFIVKRTS